MKLSFLRDRRGSTAIEYAVIASLLAVTVLAMMPIGGSLEETFQNAAAGLQK
ncbi:MAG: Flp family type IVb pilin [Hyphomonadaceae bacterium]|nr:Flp family type IVb pilin [Hyphomonadaceae bacterium]